MTSAYWSQWDHAELMSMHGIDEDQINEDLDQEEKEQDQRKDDCCSGCMYCLGLSWRDFM